MCDKPASLTETSNELTCANLILYLHYQTYQHLHWILHQIDQFNSPTGLAFKMHQLLPFTF